MISPVLKTYQKKIHVRQGVLMQFYCAVSTLCSSSGTCTSTTLSLWNLNHSLNYRSWNDCKFILSELLTKISGGKDVFLLRLIDTRIPSMIYLVCSMSTQAGLAFVQHDIEMTYRKHQNFSYRSFSSGIIAEKAEDISNAKMFY